MLGEADVRLICHCADCLAWDEPQPEGWPHYSTSNRYARFAAAIRDQARERSPEADFKVTMFIYMTYMHAPVIDIDLTGVHAAFCPWGSGFDPNYPMPEHEHEYLKKTWLDWHKTGISMHYRPNYLLTGYVMPHLSTYQSGDMFRFAAEHGMLGFDYDSLYGQWSVKGPMLYMYMRLASFPEHEIEQFRQEYFSAFGPAADMVAEYFDYWEEYSAVRAPRGGVRWGDASRAGDLYPPEAIAAAASMLEEAHRAAAGHENPVYRERVEFLQVGLEHARLAAEFTGMLRFGGRAPVTRQEFEAAGAALERLIAFRRDHEHLLFTDYTSAAWAENASLDIDVLLSGEFIEDDASLAAAGLKQPWGPWFFRKDPDDIGVRQNWFQADLTRTAKGLRVYDDQGQAFEIDRQIWTQLRVPSRLAETAVGDYLGFGWYATTFTGPEEWDDKPVNIHFEAVDEQAWVYVNGTYVGEHTVESEGVGIGELWRSPFVIKVPAGLIVSGEGNLLVVRTHASTGAAGIWGPVGAGAAE